MPNVLGLIPARSGSTGVPRKNIRDLGGKPLISHTIKAANDSDLDRVILSTDAEEYATIGQNAGAEVPFLRDAASASNTAPAIAVIRHCLDWLAANKEGLPDAVFYLQPTSPFRTTAQINSALNLLTPSVDSVASVTAVTQHPYFMFTPTNEGRLEEYVQIDPKPERRQDLPELFCLDDTIMLSWVAYLTKDRADGSPPLIINIKNFAPVYLEETPVDINTEADFRYAEFCMSQCFNSTS